MNHHHGADITMFWKYMILILFPWTLLPTKNIIFWGHRAIFGPNRWKHLAMSSTWCFPELVPSRKLFGPRRTKRIRNILLINWMYILIAWTKTGIIIQEVPWLLIMRLAMIRLIKSLIYHYKMNWIYMKLGIPWMVQDQQCSRNYIQTLLNIVLP